MSPELISLCLPGIRDACCMVVDHCLANVSPGKIRVLNTGKNDVVVAVSKKNQRR